MVIDCEGGNEGNHPQLAAGGEDYECNRHSEKDMWIWLLKVGGFLDARDMIETATPVTVVILLFCCMGLLLVVLVSIVQLFRKLGRIENLLSGDIGRSETVSQGPSVAETSPGGAFEAFLGEDPSRRSLTKGEQFTAYRQWRQQKGMNWSNS